MFITLKSRKDAGGAKRRMEQVASRSAGPKGVKETSRSLRRPACYGCQSKKLRCTGSSDSCHRCQARAIACVYPTRTGGETLRAPKPVLPLLDASDAQGVAISTTSEDGGNGSRPHKNLTHDSQRHATPTVPTSGLLACDPIDLSTEEPLRYTLNRPPPNETTTCVCLPDLIRVIQQLRDDEFGITNLPLDQVLQLHKYLIFKCCTALDCPTCLVLSTVHTMILIICDRLTEMYECIHKRIRRAGDTLRLSDDYNSSSSLSESVEPSPPQIFCSIETCESASNTRCNPEMFVDQFRVMYSNEEQVHMSHVLLKLQIRNFGQLLLRVKGSELVESSLARRAKVEALNARLNKAARDIDEALEGALADFHRTTQ
ncbi:hypothetical protein QBC35DRAFT_451461 [Podospora australis]|uniref:Zn(2)-C6 fungal-type domain-containing protein n=1 Tax=Podospora australis TaxID=1536484 RepID=A0AAN6WXJ1_9PEZI|nr:hypothetical protein QBC35DRAFT_451461 [Podospora australis]